MNNPNIIDNQNEIYTLDAGYQRSQMVAIHILRENGRAILFDSGINNSLPLLKKALEKLDLSFAEVDYLFLSHVHLDHAGGAGNIMNHCPNAKIVVHSRGARHLVDPTKLMSATIDVYGKEQTEKLYGTLIPIPENRIIIGEEGAKFKWQSREILILDTPGHARHHLCFFEQEQKVVFTGDSLGISYREMDEKNPDNINVPRQFIFSTTTPSQFSPEDLINSTTKIINLKPQLAYITHFGELRNLEEKSEILIRQINKLANIAKQFSPSDNNLYKKIKAEVDNYLLMEAKLFNSKLPTDKILEIWKFDLELDAQGLVSFLNYKK